MVIDFWIQAEFFYETLTIVLSIIVLSILFFAILVKTTQSRKAKNNQSLKNKIFWSLIATASVIVFIGIGAHLYYRPYLDEAPYMNALVRDRYRTFFGYVPYGTSEQNYYRNLNHLEALRNSELYQEKVHMQDVEFIGINNTLHYFKNERGDLFDMSQINIEYVNDINEARMVGSRFELVDPDYKNIGFRNPPYIIFERLEIPIDQMEKSFKPDNPNDVHSSHYAHPDWVF